ncbi:MAG: UDP-N-acetylglucosamine 2-epimerase (non-hydrolyzing) [Chlorobi bacterium]|nr:UDP-N-acetylglucosamine 2-epimerase (non-hydrolyzing) [Chlorobiota bacterium]
MNITVVFGTRPEAIKLAPIVHRLSGVEWCRLRVVITGQHDEMLDQMLETFGIVPDADLAIMQPGQRLEEVTVRALTGLGEEFRTRRPDVVIVQGDTTTTLAASLAAFYERISIAHVEAGLRTFDKYAPFPEEINRVLTSHIADWHYAPTERAREHLLREGIAPDRIVVTGNTAIDALQWVVAQLAALEVAERRLLLRNLPDDLFELVESKNKRIVLVTGHRRENFGAGFERICTALVQIAETEPDVVIVYPVHFNPNVRSPVERILAGYDNIRLLEPLPYREFAYMMQHAWVIITDSGGIQEEAPSLGKPVLVLREVTERPEAIEAGTARLVGTDIEQIVLATRQLLHDHKIYQAMARAHNPFGDGHAAERIINHLRMLA